MPSLKMSKKPKKGSFFNLIKFKLAKQPVKEMDKASP